MREPRIGIVIPCFNGWNYTKDCISSILYSKYENFKIFIVDDGSTDNTRDEILTNYSDIDLISGDGNYWWSKSMNKGILRAIEYGAEFILILNNDVVICNNTISTLLECAEQNPDAIIGSLVYNKADKNIIWSAGGNVSWPWPGEIQLGMNEFDDSQYKGIRSVNWTPGMGTLIRTSTLQKLSYFDDVNMPQYLSDVDLCLRAKKMGFRILINSESKIYNNVENTGGISDKTKTFNFKIIGEMFTSYRSPDYFKARLTFISRHCPRHLLIIAILFRYLRLLIFISKRII
jgi:GT2 family glycosyltransferase